MAASLSTAGQRHGAHHALPPGEAGPARILVLGDRADARAALQEAVRDAGEMPVVPGPDLDAQLAALPAPAAAVLLDVPDRGPDPLRTLERLRSRPGMQHTPVILIADSHGSLPGFTAASAAKLGAVDVLFRPVASPLLQAKIRFLAQVRQQARMAEDAGPTAGPAASGHDGKAFYLRLLESAAEGICGVDPDLQCTFMNEAGAAMLGYRPEELVGRDIHQLIHLERPDGSACPPDECKIEQALRQLTAIRVDDEVFWRKDGSTLPVSSAVSPMDVAGQVVGSVLTFTDFSQRRRIEEDLRRLAAKLSEIDRRKTEFLATLAHELRNPLAPLRTGLHVLRIAADPAAVKQTRDMMERQLTHLVRLVDDLLDIARITRGKIELSKERIELQAIVRSGVETTRPAIEAAGQWLTLQLPESPIHLDCDPVRMAQVVSNLLNNAAKYTPQGGSIELSAGIEDAAAVIRVTDNGVGIPKESLETVFEMFNQIKRTRDQTQGGLGIGLTLARRLVELHGGSVSAASLGPGQGSSFTVRLPLPTLRTAADPPATEPHGHDDAGGGNDRPPLRILIVDDNQDAAESMAVLLSLGSYRTLTAHDGQQALQRARSFQPDAILLDIGMPGLNGYEVARALRRTPGLEGVLLIAVTGWGTAEDRAETKNAGFDAHLTKPAPISAVEDLLARTLPRPSRTRTN